MIRRRSTRQFGRTRARKVASKPSWTAVKKEYGVSRTVFKTFGAIPLQCGKYLGPSWSTINEAYPTHAIALKLGTIGILKESTRFAYFKEQFDEFRIAAIQYTFTATNRFVEDAWKRKMIDADGEEVDQAPTFIDPGRPYWPHSFQTMITSYDRNSPLQEEYLSVEPQQVASIEGQQNIPGFVTYMLSEPSCTIKTVSAGNQLQQTITLTPNAKQHYNWISTSFTKVEGGNNTVYAQLLNQIFNPQVKVAVLQDAATPIGSREYLAVQIEIRIECRGAKLGYGKLQ